MALAIVGGVLLLHTGLALTFKAYYFDSVIPSKHGLIDTPTIETAKQEPLEKKEAKEIEKPPETAAQVQGTMESQKNNGENTSNKPSKEKVTSTNKRESKEEKPKSDIVQPVATKVEADNKSVSKNTNRTASSS